MDATKMAANVKERAVCTTMMVWATFRVPMMHCWPDAPAHCDHLRAMHRHEFHFKVMVAIDKDRGVEFIQLKAFGLALVAQLLRTRSTDTWSCETWAETLLRLLPNCAEVTVSEDGENGATVRQWSPYDPACVSEPQVGEPGHATNH